ncbi:uncharacterized protein LOC141900396 [Tubulanus polymorphus]|uniref:uncharacterized protein LOC141900396 n=1 Tax=Tubulanus polymorphus TaxID=672921 RepID=UPI003DA4DE79
MEAVSIRDVTVLLLVFLCVMSQTQSLPVEERGAFYRDILRQLQRGTNVVQHRTFSDRFGQQDDGEKDLIDGRVRRGSPEYLTVVRQKLDHMASSALDLKYRLQETFQDYCIRRKRAIPADKFKNCEIFAVAMTNHPLLEIPEMTSHDTGLQNLNDVLQEMLNRALNTMKRFKKVVINVTTMEEMEVCKHNLLADKACHIDCSKEGNGHEFWCQMETITKRLNSLIAHIKITMNELHLTLEEFQIMMNIMEPSSISNSQRLAYNFAALHRLMEQTTEFYEKVIELQNRIP